MWQISTKGKPMPRVLLVTPTAVYKLDPQYKITPKRVLAFNQIASIAISPSADTFVVMKGATGVTDTLIDLGGLAKVGEFVCRLTVASKAAGRVIPVEVLQSLAWNGKPLTIEKGTALFNFVKPATLYYQ